MLIDRRDDIGRLTVRTRDARASLHSTARGDTAFEELVTDPPAAVAALDEIDPAGLVAAIGVVVAGEEVAELIESQLLRVAQARGEDLELGAVGIAAQHGAGIRHGQGLAVACCDVEAAVADAEIEPAVGPESRPCRSWPRKPT